MDSENLSNTLRNLHFDVSIYKDSKHSDMIQEIEAGEFDKNYELNDRVNH